MIKGGLLQEALRFYNRTPFQFNDEWSVGKIIDAAVDSGRTDVLSEFAERVSLDHHPSVAREAYIHTIRINRPDLEKILRKYYSPEWDPIIREIFYDSIRKGDLRLVQSLGSLVRRDPEHELMAALFSDAPEMIDYSVDLYPELFKNPRVTNELAHASVAYGKLNALKELFQRAGDLIDLIPLRRSTWLNLYPEIREFLYSL